MRESKPTALATSETSAPVASHTADKEFILDILCASIAFAAYKTIQCHHKCLYLIHDKIA